MLFNTPQKSYQQSFDWYKQSCTLFSRLRGEEKKKERRKQFFSFTHKRQVYKFTHKTSLKNQLRGESHPLKAIAIKSMY